MPQRVGSEFPQPSASESDAIIRELFLLSESGDFVEGIGLLVRIAKLAGFSDAVVMTSHLGRHGYVWRVIAASNALSAKRLGARAMDAPLSTVFPEGVCVSLLDRAAASERANGRPGAILCRELAAEGFRTMLPVYVQGSRNMGQIAVFALEARAASSPGLPLQEKMSMLRLAAAALASNCARQVETSKRRLSKSERAVLEMLAAGMSPAEIAECRQISVRTVRNQLESAKRRLDASTSVHAVVIAIETGAILNQGV